MEAWAEKLTPIRRVLFIMKGSQLRPFQSDYNEPNRVLADCSKIFCYVTREGDSAIDESLNGMHMPPLGRIKPALPNTTRLVRSFKYAFI